MNHHTTTKSDRKHASKGLLRISIILIILIVLTLISATLLAVRLVNYINMDKREVVLQSDVEQQMEIFSVQYDNESGEITVKGMDDQSVIAPGTEVEYTFYLKNGDETAVDYDMVPDIHFTSE